MRKRWTPTDQVGGVNPALQLGVANGQIILGANTAFAAPVGPACVETIRHLEARRAGATGSAHSYDILVAASELGFLVSSEAAAAMRTDRRIAAWSLMGRDPLETAEFLRCSEVLVIGAGGVGSCAALALAKAGVGNLVLCDSDIVNQENINKSLFFRRSDLGKRKVEVLAELANEAGAEVNCISTKIESYEQLNHVLPHVPNVLIWAGDDDEWKSFITLARGCTSRGIPIIRGGIYGWKVLIGPTLTTSADVLREVEIKARRFTELQPSISAFNSKAINPGTAMSVSITASLIATEAIMCLLPSAGPLLRHRCICFDLLSMKFSYLEG